MKDKVYGAVDMAKPYAERIARDDELHEHVKNAYASARSIYDELLGSRGAQALATRVAQDKDMQAELKKAVEELRKAGERVQGKSSHTGRNFMLLLAGITLGVLFNPAIRKAAWNSLALSTVTAILCGLIGLLLGYCIVKGRGTRVSRAVEQASFLPYVIPSIAFGAIYLSMFARPVGPIPALYGTFTLLVLVSVVVWALYTVLLRLRPEISPVSFIATTFFVGVVAMAPLAAWETQPLVWRPGVGAAFLYVALLPSLLSYFIYNHATRIVGPARAGQAITLMPLFGAFLSAALLGERLHAFHFAGMVLILAGIGISLLSGRGQDVAGAAKEPPLEDRA